MSWLPDEFNNQAPLVPPILHVNSEARQLALRFYQKRIWVWGDTGRRKVGVKRIKRRYYYFREGFDRTERPQYSRKTCGGRVNYAEYVSGSE